MLPRLRAEGTGKPLVLLVTVGPDSAARFPSLAACWTRDGQTRSADGCLGGAGPASGTSGALGLTDGRRGLIG
jgi:hypothetical protein